MSVAFHKNVRLRVPLALLNILKGVAKTSKFKEIKSISNSLVGVDKLTKALELVPAVGVEEEEIKRESAWEHALNPLSRGLLGVRNPSSARATPRSNMTPQACNVTCQTAGLTVKKARGFFPWAVMMRVHSGTHWRGEGVET